ncbi:MAG: DNA-binding protein [Ruminococcaceae bacterium]|nr:DNA-binding protein [Oscillospiraceae bacterium]
MLYRLFHFDGKGGSAVNEDRAYICRLIDIYGNALSERQKDVVDLYYNEDLSLTEISENCGITRQGVRDAIRHGVETLHSLEKELGIFVKNERIAALASELKTACDNERVASIADKIIAEVL